MPAINYTDTGLKIQQALSGTDTVKLPGSQCCGTVLMARGEYSVASGIAQGDTIRIVRLPKGAVIIPHLCRIEAEALGTGFSVKIGDTVDDDKYAAAITLSAAGSQTFSGGSGALTPVPLENTDWITATVTAVTSPSLGKKAMFWLAYIMP